MAVVRARSAPPYALILFVFLWVVSTALAVTFYLSASKQSELNDTNQKRYDAVVSSRDTQAVQELLAQKTSPNASALGVAVEQIAALKKVVGAPDRPVPEIVAPNGVVDQALTRAGLQKGMSLVEAITSLNGKLVAETRNAQSLQTNFAALQAQVNSDKQNYEAAAGSANKSAEDFKNQLAAAAAAQAAADADKQKALQADQDALTAANQKAEDDRRANVLQIEQLRQQLAQNNQRIQVLTDEIDRLRPTNKTTVGREPAGTVVRAATGAREVYISLGRRDHVTPGLTFAVYDPAIGVRFDTDADAAGKGSLEVIEVGDTESLCRITNTTKGQSIQSGDLIANPAYQHDKNRTFHFVVIGDFDLDGDSVATAAERDRLIGLVRSWGGVIDDKVTTQTDFLVTGTRPPAPMIGSDDTAPGSVAAERIKKQQAYDDTITEAKRSSVPILNANRFLAMIGYYNTTVARD